MPQQNLVLLKIGGALLRELPDLLDAVAAPGALPPGRSVIVHGAGPQLSRAMQESGLEPEFVAGRRVTTEREMALVDSVLGGQVNADLVRGLLGRGIPAVGLRAFDGGLQVARALDLSSASHTGVPESGNPALLHTLLDAGFLPVLSPVSRDARGMGINVNADDCARGLLDAVPFSELLMCSDVPGVKDANGAVIPELATGAVHRAIADGVIRGGMIPKVEAALAALLAGCEVVRIGTITGGDSLLRLRSGEAGTAIVADPA